MLNDWRWCAVLNDWRWAAGDPWPLRGLLVATRHSGLRGHSGLSATRTRTMWVVGAVAIRPPGQRRFAVTSGRHASPGDGQLPHRRSRFAPPPNLGGNPIPSTPCLTKPLARQNHRTLWPCGLTWTGAVLRNSEGGSLWL